MGWLCALSWRSLQVVSQSLPPVLQHTLAQLIHDCYWTSCLVQAQNGLLNGIRDDSMYTDKPGALLVWKLAQAAVVSHVFRTFHEMWYGWCMPALMRLADLEECWDSCLCITDNDTKWPNFLSNFGRELLPHKHTHLPCRPGSQSSFQWLFDTLKTSLKVANICILKGENWFQKQDSRENIFTIQPKYVTPSWT